ncbi:hypothetical protein C8J57DRAFT_1521044 [Mycena rebaudengoi]|nr:hypothetical protein C8J57DRAFT_1521044 [Mycena rebaudengoi]
MSHPLSWDCLDPCTPRSGRRCYVALTCDLSFVVFSFRLPARRLVPLLIRLTSVAPGPPLPCEPSGALRPRSLRAHSTRHSYGPPGFLHYESLGALRHAPYSRILTHFLREPPGCLFLRDVGRLAPRSLSAHFTTRASGPLTLRVAGRLAYPTHSLCGPPGSLTLLDVGRLAPRSPFAHFTTRASGEMLVDANCQEAFESPFQLCKAALKRGISG